jgi:hypothetical protein
MLHMTRYIHSKSILRLNLHRGILNSKSIYIFKAELVLSVSSYYAAILQVFTTKGA